MKGFKSTGNGPRYVQNFAVGGLATGKAPEAPGFSDFRKGGKVMTKKAAKEAERRKALSNAGKLLRKARGGKVAGCSDPMSAKQALAEPKARVHDGAFSFMRKPKIGK